MSPEARRQFVHLSMTAFALALRWLTPVQAAACAVGAVALTWLVLPALGASLRREGGPFVDGVRTYPLAVFGLILVLPLPAAAAAWAVLGVGDATSNLVGRRFGKPPLLGRDDRSLAGSLAFVATAAPAAILVHWFVTTIPPDGTTCAAMATAALAGAAAEFVPLPRWLDDNIPVAVAAGGALALML